jgi:protein gp37
MRMAARLQAMGHHKYKGTTRKSGGRYVWTGRVNVDPSSLSAPLEWRRPKRIFVNSMSDLFHEKVPDDFIEKVWDVMAECPQHHFQILTKRPDRMAAMFRYGQLVLLQNVWLGTSVESQDVAGRVEELAAVTDATLFVSFEPLIGRIDDIDLRKIHWAIVGGESGPRARPMDSEWVDRLHEICGRDDVAFFFKQWGGRNKKAAGRELHGQTYDAFPIELDA